MAYVDLNPIRAGMTKSLPASHHTSIQQRIKRVKQDAIYLEQVLSPLHGTLIAFLPMKLRDYIELVEWTGKQVRSDKRGAIAKHAPPVLKQLHLSEKRWTTQVKGIGSRFWRVVGDVEDLLEAAKRLNQRWLKGLGTAAILAKIE
jgi:hypothetical protein